MDMGLRVRASSEQGLGRAFELRPGEGAKLRAEIWAQEAAASTGHFCAL